MVFSSFVFLLIFLPLCLGCSFAARSTRAKNAVLCAFSLVFYAWGEPVYLLLMLASIGVNWLIGLVMERFPERKKALLAAAVLLNIGAIGYFKYTDFLIGTANALFGAHIAARDIALPIGISFYTFQILSYVIDVYRGRCPAQRSLLRLATYISLFPQLVAGPIVRYEEVERELDSRTVTREDFTRGLTRLMTGLGKKVLIANQMALLADAVFDAPELPGCGALWLGALAYSLQIYFDFSGYSDMAIGMGRMFGFHFSENFRYPYAARSVTDFWRRWHISLSGWFRDYVYIPLGGSRVSLPRHMLNLLAVWTLTGLWHGASWNFVLWGLYYGILLILEKYVIYPGGGKSDGRRGLAGAACRVLTLLAVLFGWVLFRVENPGRLGAALTGMVRFGTGGPAAFLAEHGALLRPAAMILPAALLSLPLLPALDRRFGGRSWYGTAKVLAAGVLWLLSLAALLGDTYNPFIYFRF